jgi:hypothetical protein
VAMHSSEDMSEHVSTLDQPAIDFPPPASKQHLRVESVPWLMDLYAAKDSQRATAITLCLHPDLEPPAFPISRQTPSVHIALGNTREVKSAPSSPSRSPTPCRFKHSHLASRVSQVSDG